MVASVLAGSVIKKNVDFSLEAISKWLNVLFCGDRNYVLDNLSETFPWTLTVKMNSTISTNDGWRCTHCTTCQSTTPHPRDKILLGKVKQHVKSRLSVDFGLFVFEQRFLVSVLFGLPRARERNIPFFWSTNVEPLMKLDTTAIAIPATDGEAPADPMKLSDFNCFELY